MDSRGRKILGDKIRASGYHVVQISYKKGSLQVLAEKKKYKGMTLKDCEFLSRTLSPFLDSEDLVKESYLLEVSSPGIRRPLTTEEDFRHYKGHMIECTNRQSVVYNGVIGKVSEDWIELRLKGGDEVKIDFEYIRAARLEGSYD